MDLLSRSVFTWPGATPPTLCEATDATPDTTHPSSGALSVDKDCLLSRQPKHGQIRALGTSVPGLSVPKKEKSENDFFKKSFYFWSSGPGVLEGEVLMMSTLREGSDDLALLSLFHFSKAPTGHSLDQLQKLFSEVECETTFFLPCPPICFSIHTHTFAVDGGGC